MIGNKQISIAVSLTLCSLAATAQNGFFITRSMGLGVSNWHNPLTNYLEDGSVYITKRHAGLSYNFQGTTGYQFKKWRIQAGLQYLRTGYKASGLLFPEDDGPGENRRVVIESSSAYSVGFHQVGIPISIGYSIPVANKITLVPYGGLMPSFTLLERYKQQYVLSSGRATVTNSAIGSYGYFRGWFIAGTDLEYKLSSKLSISIGLGNSFNLISTGNKSDAALSNAHINLGLSVGL